MAFKKHGLCGQDTSQGKREPTFLPKRSKPAELYHSSGKIISPRATFTSPINTRATCSLKAMESEIRKRKEPTISPIPRLLTLSAMNFCRTKTF